MMKLNAGFSRRVGEPNYGSRGASVNVELELESGLIGDPSALVDRVRRLFQLVREAVEEELRNGQAASDGQPGTVGSRSADDGNGQQNAWYATRSQIRAIKAICNWQGVDPVPRHLESPR